MPKTIEALLLILAIIAPGYLMREAISLSRPREEKSDFENILDSIILGFLNSLIFILLLIFLWKLNIIKLVSFSFDKSFFQNVIIIIKNDAWKFATFLFGYIFLVPSLLGWLLGKWKGSITLFKKKIEIAKINPYPSAWDEFFTNTYPVTLYIVLKSGEKICGTFGKKSKASTNPKQRDIYMEREISLDKDGNVSGIIQGESGLWIHRDEISYFKVLPLYEFKEN